MFFMSLLPFGIKTRDITLLIFIYVFMFLAGMKRGDTALLMLIHVLCSPLFGAMISGDIALYY